ncbi:hypothetical protein FF1_002166 [Malus domestica]|uniref:cyclic nucleotide-gated ion channel 1-like isoform X2 n=1 Tax=Malus sylvestris TaxID=3752 RepID=UPI0021AC9EB8|nr:cyclic nucleotide-gated ion channel 1-like isoform X2 [Malus sylvestris]
MAGNVKGLTSDMENQAEEKTDREAGEYSKSMCSRDLNLIKKIRKTLGPYLPRWSIIYVISCVFAVSIDPFFFYIVIIDQDNKCFQIDKTLAFVAFLMRLITDVIFLVHLICEICDRVQNPNTLEIAPKMLPWLSIYTVIDLFALIPLPQVLIGVMFYTMKGSGFVEHIKVLNIFLLCQYFPRIYRIYLSAKEYKITNSIWVKGLYNLFLYILASHLLGALWYFFSIERELSCWHEACVNHSIDPRECINTFYCDSRSTMARNITFLNEHCPLDTLDGALSPFNFGIFLDSLKNQNTEHIKFEKKFFYSLWWGLRNLSNFGTNLTTSTYVWENLFAVAISVVGLLLFLYLIGNVQTYMQMEASKAEELSEKIKLKKLEVRTWMSRNEIPDVMKEAILSNIRQNLKRHIDADLHHFLFYILPVNIRTHLKHCLCMKTLQKVKTLEDMDVKVLTFICNYLKPVRYTENSFVFRMGDPLDCMLFIIEGTVWTYGSTDSQAGQGISSMDTKPLGKGDFYGEELLDCASHRFTKLPVSSKHVKTQTKVEAFVLMAKDLETVVSKSRLEWEKKKKKGSQLLESVAASTIASAFRLHLRKNKRALQ